MFLRRNRKRSGDEVYEYWTLVESVRTARGPRQRVVATLGKLPGLDTEERAGWDEIARLLDGRPRPSAQGDLFRAEPEPPRWAQVDLSSVRVERVREFGKAYLGLALWRRLGLHEFFEAHARKGREQVDWATVACILSLGRFCAQGSELALGEHWYATTALDDLLGVSAVDVYDNRLYRGLDELLPLREELFGHLRERYRSLFGSRFEFLLYDVTSTYFEGQAERNPQAQRGYSRDKRPDCKQVCIGLVVTPEGLPLAYEVFAGNRADVTTVEDIVDLMEKKYGRAERIWAMDRGMVSEDNLDYLRERDALYIVGTPKGRLRKFERELHDHNDWRQVEPGVEVKLIDHPDSKGKERYVLCRSEARHEKEAAMLRRQCDRLRTKLMQIDASLKKRPQKPLPIERRIGKWLGRNTAAEKVFAVTLIIEDEMAVGLEIEEDESKLDWAQASQGAYLLRTNCTEQDPCTLWRWYIHLTEVEDAFRVGKSDLGMRPVYHQREDRVQAHIMVCFLALAMWRCLEMWLASRDLGNCARQVLEQMATIHSMDVVLPIKSNTTLRLRLVAKPEKLAADLLAHMQLKIPTRPKTIQNVVEKTGGQ
ncbi:MAG: IS1634 family transposase [Verrucomicrobia bacterium]|nr:IS1634 family transposase [Verrucomicrobiota bacterium]